MADEKQWRRVIDLKDGSGVQVFEAETHEELTEKLAVAQENATRKIQELSQKVKELTPRDKAQPIKVLSPREMTVDERFQVTQDLQDPTKSVEAVNRIVEASLGAPINEVRQRLSKQEEADERARIKSEAEVFMAGNEDFVPCVENEKLMFERLEKDNLAINQKNLQDAFEELKAAGLLVLRTETVEEPPPAESRIATSRPRGSQSSSLRSSQSGVVVGTQSKRITMADINRMPTAELESKMRNDPVFRKQVDEMYASA